MGPPPDISFISGQEQQNRLAATAASLAAFLPILHPAPSLEKIKSVNELQMKPCMGSHLKWHAVDLPPIGYTPSNQVCVLTLLIYWGFVSALFGSSKC